MIYLYTGTPGSGKSLDAARFIYNYNKKGNPIISNMQIDITKLVNPDLYLYYFNDDLNVDILKNFAIEYFGSGRPREGAITCIIDEAQMMFNSRTWNEKSRKSWNEFFTIHRHFGYDFIFITQFDGMLDKQLRALVEVEVLHRKVSNMGFKGKLFSLVFFCPNLMVKIHIYYPLGQKLSSEFFRPNKKFYSLYDTYALSFNSINHK